MDKNNSVETLDSVGLETETEEALIRRLEEIGAIPFDLNAIVSPSAAIYGALGSGALVGVWAKFTGTQVHNLLEETHDVNGFVGLIVGDNHGQIVLQMSNGFLGWLNPDQFKLVNVIIPNITWLN